MSRYGPIVAAVLFGLSILLFVVVSIYNLEHQHQVDQRICESAVENRQATRRGWLSAQQFIIRGQTTEVARAATREFFSEVLAEIPPLRCEDREPVEVPQ